MMDAAREIIESCDDLDNDSLATHYNSELPSAGNTEFQRPWRLKNDGG